MTKIYSYSFNDNSNQWIIEKKDKFFAYTGEFEENAKLITSLLNFADKFDISAEDAEEAETLYLD